MKENWETILAVEFVVVVICLPAIFLNGWWFDGMNKIGIDSEIKTCTTLIEKLNNANTTEIVGYEAGNDAKNWGAYSGTIEWCYQLQNKDRYDYEVWWRLWGSKFGLMFLLMSLVGMIGMMGSFRGC